MPGAPPAYHVATRVISKYGDRLHEKAICLTTPVASTEPLARHKLKPALAEFVKRYEPRAEADGLYSHQAQVIAALTGSAAPNVVMTTATGSGKSLGFWSWAVHLTSLTRTSNVLATFPTQALLWGQAKRLAAISNPKTLVEFPKLKGVHFAGVIKLGAVEVPWTVWFGVSGSDEMRAHENSQSFANARLRLSTLDKAEWSLMQEKQADFLSNLRGVIVDEAHVWHGLGGANVRATFNRLQLSIELMGEPRPAFFLASATLADAAEFASQLTGASAASFTAIEDRSAAKATIVDATDVPDLLLESGGLRRYVFLLKPNGEAVDARKLVGDADLLGEKANALCFVQSKFIGHRLREDLRGDLPEERDVVVYDGDLPPADRRRLESELFDNNDAAKVIVGTSALELGVDLPALDVVVMDELPARRSDLLQRLGRVGRSADRPGLAILSLDYGPAAERLIEEPLAAVSVAKLKPLQLPLHLEAVRLRSMKAVFAEWDRRVFRTQQVLRSDFKAALKRYFGEAPDADELDEYIEQVLGDLVDLDDGSWFYKGFRVSASQGKIALVLDGTKKKVAVIEDTQVFRDAHPEGIYLGHGGASFRVERYVGRWDVAQWKSPGSDVVLGKFMKGLDRIIVRAEKPHRATRGRWRDTFSLEESRPLDGVDTPAQGQLTYGIFTFLRKFDGYRELDLKNGGRPKVVSLAEVTGRFAQAIEEGTDFPFLHNFSYRTTGWKWLVARHLDPEERKRIAPSLSVLLEGFLADAVECSSKDIQVTFVAKEGELRVVDTTPGGNGLSEALLRDGRVSGALSAARKAVRTHGEKNPDTFKRFLAEYRADTDLTAKEIASALDKLARAWNG